MSRIIAEDPQRLAPPAGERVLFTRLPAPPLRARGTAERAGFAGGLGGIAIEILHAAIFRQSPPRDKAPPRRMSRWFPTDRTIGPDGLSQTCDP